jgi:hypothetical protein
LEITLVKAFHWSLRDIDETDIYSLLPFVFRINHGKTGGTGSRKRKTYIDQAGFL